MFAFPPPPNDLDLFPIRLADWVEINLVTQEEAGISVTSVAMELAGPPPDHSDDSEQRADQDAESSRDDNQARTGYWEAAVGKAEDAFAELAERAELFEGCYPLKVISGAALVDESKGTFELYRFLVLLRARQLYPGALGDDGEESGYLFEEVVTHALGGLLASKPAHRVRFGVALNSRGVACHCPLKKLSMNWGSECLKR